MGRNDRTILGGVALDYCKKFPDTSSRSLARKLLDEHPLLFKSMEQARCRVRYYRGAIGNVPRGKRIRGAKQKGDIQTMSKLKTPDPVLPDPEPDEWKPEPLSDLSMRWLVLGDIHVPYHDKDALTEALKKAKEEKCSGVILLGDFIDSHHLSRFCKDPRKRSYAQEIATGVEMLEGIKSYLKPKRFVLKTGNHDDRLNIYLMTKAAEIFDLPQVQYQNLLELDRLKVRYIPEGRPLTAGKLFLLHGHEFSRGITSPVNPARGVFLKGHDCAIVAHSHVSSSHTETTFAGRSISTWSVGCLCQLHPEYARLNKWNHGFGILRTKKGAEDAWEFSNYRIVKGKVRPA